MKGCASFSFVTDEWKSAFVEHIRACNWLHRKRVLLEKLIVAHLAIFCVIYGNRRFTTVFGRTRHWLLPEPNEARCRLEHTRRAPCTHQESRVPSHLYGAREAGGLVSPQTWCWCLDSGLLTWDRKATEEGCFGGGSRSFVVSVLLYLRRRANLGCLVCVGGGCLLVTSVFCSFDFIICMTFSWVNQVFTTATVPTSSLSPWDCTVWQYSGACSSRPVVEVSTS